MRPLNDAEMLAEMCPKCKAAKGQVCKTESGAIYALRIGDDEQHFHRARYFAAYAEQFKSCFGLLDETDKALILYYAYTMLCDSVSTHSEKLLGRKHTSRDVQVMFAQEAVKQLRKDGLLGTSNPAISRA